MAFVTGTSGPGVALKGEAIGLAVMAELPLVIINVQRAGPSTGMPTKAAILTLLNKLKKGGVLKVMREGSGRRPQVLALAELINLCEGKDVI